MGYIIYQIENKINNKKYIGFTSKTLEQRWNKHLNDAKSGRKTYLCNAIRKYGSEHFVISILQIEKDLSVARDFLEQQHITNTNTHYLSGTGYNMTLGGEGTMGHKHSAETKAKMSKSHTGIKQSSEAKAKLSEQRMGSKNPNYGKQCSKKEKEERRSKNIEFYNTNGKAYKITLPSGDVVITNNRKEFCRTHNLNYFSVVDAIKRGKPYKGYEFCKLEKD